MEYCSTTLRLQVNRILALCLFSVCLFSYQKVWAGGKDATSFSDTYSLSAIEYCEIYLSWVTEPHPDYNSEQYMSCKKMDTFKPVRTLTAKEEKDSKEKIISLSSAKDNDWPLINVNIKAELKSWRFMSTSLMIDGHEYNLSEYVLGHSGGYRSIEVGYLDKTIILRLKNKSITQLAIMPTYCENGSIDYTVEQIFSWYPPLLESSYQKTFIKTPSCT